jgi:hypothetical protein
MLAAGKSLVFMFIILSLFKSIYSCLNYVPRTICVMHLSKSLKLILYLAAFVSPSKILGPFHSQPSESKRTSDILAQC